MPLEPIADMNKITVFQQNGTTEILNVFYYSDPSATPSDPIDIATSFWQHVKTQWRAWLPVGYSNWFLKVRCENHFAPYAFADYFIPAAEQVGTRSGTGDLVTPFLSGSIRLVVASRATRPGSKRIAGMQEGDFAGSFLLSATVTLLQTLGDRFALPFTTTLGGDVLTPMIVHFQGGGPNPTTYQPVTAAIALNNLTHQVSRDPRRD